MHRWLVSPGFDLSLIIGPPLLAVALALGSRPAELPGWGWLIFVVFIDVAHVYSSLYRTYFDPTEFSRRRSLYVLTPLACLSVGVVLYSLGELVFWRILAYVAIFHFVRQQYGFIMVYRHRMGERSRWDLYLDKAAIYATMLYPLAFWHAYPDREFAWFVDGDFIYLPTAIASFARWAYAAILTAFVLRQAAILLGGSVLNWGKIGIVSSTAAVWYVGIVYLNSDFAFTVTNVVAHGIPYMALVWLYGRRRWGDSTSWLRLAHRPVAAGLFVAPLLALAYVEEGLWDSLVWHEHGTFFGGLGGLDPPGAALTLIVPLLTIPQATHYILDAWIWKFDGSNPGLERYLFGDSRASTKV